MPLGNLNTEADLTNWLKREFPVLGAANIAQRLADLETTVETATVRGVESLRVVRGLVNSAGTIREGTGFAVTKSATGVYDIVFDTAFSDVPATAVGITGDGGVAFRPAAVDEAAAPSASSVRVKTYNTAFVATDGAFHFVSVGPR